MNVAFQLFRSKNRMLGLIRPQLAAQKAKDLFLTPRQFPLKNWEQEKEVAGQRISLDGGLSVISWGESERKILLMHGWESRATQLAGFVDSLVLLGFKVIALDAPAHGHSSGTQANPLVFAEAILNVDKQLGPFYGMVGHSMGGSAVGIALSLGLQCDKVVLISSPSSIIDVLNRFARFIGLPKKSAQQFIGLVEAQVGRPARELDVAQIVMQLAITGLVIHDRQDVEVPFRDAQTLKQYWPSARLLATDGYGHRAIVRQPDVWQHVSEFFSTDSRH